MKTLKQLYEEQAQTQKDFDTAVKEFKHLLEEHK